METTLDQLYASIRKNVQTVYVFPKIEHSSQFNPYLRLFYKDLVSSPDKQKNILVTSPHPLFPLFIIKRIFGEKNIVHFHWVQFWDFPGFLVLLWKMSCILLYKLCGGHIVWSVHNKHLHSKRFITLNILFRKLMARIATRLHVHCGEAIRIMAPTLKVPENKFVVIPHPMYPVSLIDQKQARDFCRKNLVNNLDANKPLFLMYGNIGEYKGILDMIPLLTDDSGELVIAGECKKYEHEYFHRIEKAADKRNNIHLISSFLSQKDETNLFNAADCIIFNFQDILSSGSVMLALSYKKEIIIPNIGCLKELCGPGINKFSTVSELQSSIEVVSAKIRH